MSEGEDFLMKFFDFESQQVLQFEFEEQYLSFQFQFFHSELQEIPKNIKF
jgi:hypothetical protein